MKFPKIWLGDYLFFHYFDQAIQNGKHAKILKCRGLGLVLKLLQFLPAICTQNMGFLTFTLQLIKGT